MSRRGGRALLVGVGGLGCPAALALARAGVAVLGLCDDDVVDRTNLHRQILFRDVDVGVPKLDAAAAALARRAPALVVRTHRTRLVPENAVSLVGEYDVVLEGSDNFATKFLCADACALSSVPVVHAAAVRWIGTVLSVGHRGGPCYRCLFEDLPPDGAMNCDSAGVMGPVVGLVAAAQADLALAVLAGRPAHGTLVTVDGRSGTMRRRNVARRPDCPLCGEGARIERIDAQAYLSRECAG